MRPLAPELTPESGPFLHTTSFAFEVAAPPRDSLIHPQTLPARQGLSSGEPREEAQPRVPERPRVPRNPLPEHTLDGGLGRRLAAEQSCLRRRSGEAGHRGGGKAPRPAAVWLRLPSCWALTYKNEARNAGPTVAGRQSGPGDGRATLVFVLL